MDDLRPLLRFYLRSMSVLAAVLVVSAAAALTLSHGWIQAQSAVALVFLLLMSIGERMTARARADFFHSMSTVMLVAAILVLPAPYPIVVAFGAALLVDVSRPLPRYKYLYNVAHAVIVAGGASLARTWAAPPLQQWQPAAFLAHAPAIAIVSLVYALIDLGDLHSTSSWSSLESTDRQRWLPHPHARSCSWRG